MRTATRPHPARLVAAVAAGVLAIAGCSGDAGDEALTGSIPVDDVPTEDGATDAVPREDVPGVTGAEPADDVDTEVDGGDAQGAGQVPPLLDAIDGWDETIVTLEGAPDHTTILAKVAADTTQRQQGLMNVEDLPDGVGVLFLFEEPRTGGFWMKDTLVPLDIAYVLDGEVVAVMQMDPCGDQDPCPTYDPGVPYDAALEVNKGALDAAGVSEGTTVTWTDPTPVSGT